jgi:hypothetical protein
MITHDKLQQIVMLQFVIPHTNIYYEKWRIATSGFIVIHCDFTGLLFFIVLRTKLGLRNFLYVYSFAYHFKVIMYTLFIFNKIREWKQKMFSSILEQRRTMKNDEEWHRFSYKNDVVLHCSWKKNYYEEWHCSSSRMLFLIFFYPSFLFVYFIKSPPRECWNFTKLEEALDLTFFCKK